MGKVILPGMAGWTPAPEPLPKAAVPLGSWISQARCAGADLEVFFPPRGSGKADAAKAICATCPVRRECLRYALKAPEDDGVWGGLDQAEREEIRRRRRKAARKRQGAA
jgi:WhiB family transcriptional regulator, redox-sensing transcriptional regulator